MTHAQERLELLLAHADTGHPVLNEGLLETTAAEGPDPQQSVRGDDALRRRRHDANRNDLPLQRWGLVVPEGDEGDRMVEALSALIRFREAEQGAKAHIFRVPPNMDAKASVRWKNQVYWSEKIPNAERPLYLLLLGDLHQTSIELQHSLANATIVGRVHFTNDTGRTNFDAYAAYADKVVRFAQKKTEIVSPNLLFYVARDGTPATQVGRSKLIEPLLSESNDAKQLENSSANEVTSIVGKTVHEFLEAGKSLHPSVLFTVSHGLGAPRGGWKTPEEQWAGQGAMSIAQDEKLTAEVLRGQTFLPGGLWFFLACFGAGTPSSSVYAAWLDALAKQGVPGAASATAAALQNLPRSGERPFLAKLPQVALSNPEGPLAVIGHVDLAWTFSFTGGKMFSESRKSRFSSMIDVMVRGSRVGVALDALLDFYRESNDALTAQMQLEADGQGSLETAADRVERGQLWMLRNDLRGYILLGDPAARLPLQQNVISSPETPLILAVEPKPDAPESISILAKESAVLAMIRGDEAPRAIAQQAGVSLETLWQWVDAYRSGGRERL